MNGSLLLLLLPLLTNIVESANILYIVPFSSVSHYILLRPIGLELARRGHNVTVITSQKEKDPPTNYHEVLVDDKKIWDLLGTERPNVFTMVNMSAEDFHKYILWAGGLAFTELTLNSTDVKKFLKKDNNFDLVISEQFYQEALYTLAYKYNTPLVLVTTFGNCMRHNVVNRNPLQLATVTSDFLDVKDPTSFWGRFRNFYFSAYDYIWWRFWYLKKQEDLVVKYLPEIAKDVPSLYALQKNVSLMLINSHFSYDTPSALLPNIIEIGGVHLSNSNASLPEDLQKLLDESNNGVVYINFGSNVRSSELPQDKKVAFLNVFRRLKQTILWKWEDDQLDNKPSNLVTRKWLPQKEILAHRNIKVFVSHGGLIGTQEAIFNGVPLIGVPIYADQFNNLLLVEEAGFGKILQYHDINEKTLYDSLSEILNNNSYMEKVKEISQAFKDRPMTALDTAMFWIEYIIRNKGADYMKNPARNMSWVAYTMIDVYASILIFLIIVIVISVKVIRAIFNVFCVNKIQGKNKKKRL
ncbi:UDP-glycosyltransferase UGT5-like [Vanessa cardui]|uniref:UDP-glycosyltransferase UGT5-like n=1 Tax=Vanessa cardui TaxID=171605 RepID=UPI001F139BA0|nr:UDP-glycosyltransferase UGT5-like [Vanessa cardui]